jgi:hypothetical protein
MKYTFLILLVFAITLNSCHEAGTSTTSLHGSEQTLPDELKGLKIYTVSTGGLSYVQVGVLDNARTTSLSHSEGKHHESFILVEKNTGRTIPVGEIISENDSIIVCKK